MPITDFTCSQFKISFFICLNGLCTCVFYCVVLRNAGFLYCLCVLQGFDEYMNLVLEDAEEINIKKNTRKSLG